MNARKITNFCMELWETRNIPYNTIVVKNGRLEPDKRMYSDGKMDVLLKEHGFIGYLDETFTAPDPIMQALINNHKVDKVIVGGEEVQKSLERKDLIEFLCTREAHDNKPGKVASCFYYTNKNASYKYTSQPSRYTGEIGTSSDDIRPAQLLRPGSDPGRKDALAEAIRNAEETIERLQPEIEEGKNEIEKFNQHGQEISAQLKNAKRAKQDYQQYRMKLQNQKDKLADAEENAAKDNDREKAKMVARIKKLVESSITMSENAAKAHNECMKSTYTLTGVKMTEDGLSDSLRKIS